MNDNMITLPRSVVAALVDPDRKPYMSMDDHCAHCGYDEWIKGDHDASCPVRRAQEALKEQTQ